jgi:D-alanyl-D-alanine dipeptidase
VAKKARKSACVSANTRSLPPSPCSPPLAQRNKLPRRSPPRRRPKKPTSSTSAPWSPTSTSDIRYAGANNFTGAPVDGYEAPKCFLLRPSAEALARVENKLRDDHMRLRLYDCYRPVRAVQTSSPGRTRRRWPHEGRVLPGVRESPRCSAITSRPPSGHSRGATVDLDLMECDDTGVACTPLDMGTHFDFFDTLANTDSKQATDVQRANRHRLRDAMEVEGLSATIRWSGGTSR